MSKIIFILGGARSGKSNYAIKLAKKSGEKVTFIATCLPLDSEMKQRIKLHKKGRPSQWQTFEAPYNINAILKKSGHHFNTIIIDCLTLLISNLISQNLSDKAIEARITKMLHEITKLKCNVIIVANEVGLGIVPMNKLARRFRDIAGRINQQVAQQADKVIFMASGLPLIIKKGKR